jgi:salicylate hydroxylase
VRDAISADPEGYWREFAQFAGPSLEKIVGWGKIVLIGDASHPLNGVSPVIFGGFSALVLYMN